MTETEAIDVLREKLRKIEPRAEHRRLSEAIRIALISMHMTKAAYEEAEKRPRLEERPDTTVWFHCPSCNAKLNLAVPVSVELSET